VAGGGECARARSVPDTPRDNGLPRYRRKGPGMLSARTIFEEIFDNDEAFRRPMWGGTPAASRKRGRS